MVKMITLCKPNFTFVHKKSKKQEKEPDTNFVLSSWPRNMIVPFIKTHLQREIKIQQFFMGERIQKWFSF